MMNKRINRKRLLSSFNVKKTGILSLFIIFCTPLFALKKIANKQYLILSNPAAFSRTNEVVTLERIALGKVNSNLFPQLKKGSRIFTTQTVDKNGDGNWDELLIEVNLAANAKDTLQLTWVKEAEQKQFKKYTNVRLSLRSDNDIPSAEINKAQRLRGFTQNIAKPFYQMEGPGIENDKVAFRAFFDYRNGKDVYGKIVDTAVLEKVGVGATWHDLQPWGMDIFHTGNSLSAGALAVEEDKQVIRLGDADTSTFEALYEGALEAAFKLTFKNWDVAKGKQDGSETVSMTKGNFYYKNEIALSLNNQQNLISGVANFGMDKVVYKKHNTALSSISTYGNQAEGTNTKLGVAIMFASDAYRENKTADTLSVIPNTSYVVFEAGSQKKRTIYFFACWEKTDTRFTTEKGFEDYLEQTAQKLANPVKIKMIRKS